MKVVIKWNVLPSGQQVGEPPPDEERTPILVIEPENEAEGLGLVEIFGPYRDALVVRFELYREADLSNKLVRKHWIGTLKRFEVEPARPAKPVKGES